MDNEEYGPPPTGFPDGSPRPASQMDPFRAPSPDQPPIAPSALQSPPYPLAPSAPPPLGLAYAPQEAPQYPTPFGQPLPSWPPVASTKSNWMGITSLVLGLIGGGVLGAVFGGMGISAANKGRATNKVMAIWGLVLNIVVPLLLLAAALSAGALSGALSSDTVAFSELELGDCVAEPSGWNGDMEELGNDLVTVLPCDEEHWGQVYEIRDLMDGPYPGDEGAVPLAEDICFADAASSRIDPARLDEMYVNYVTPTEEAWGLGDRQVICFATTVDNRVTGSWMADS